MKKIFFFSPLVWQFYQSKVIGLQTLLGQTSPMPRVKGLKNKNYVLCLHLSVILLPEASLSAVCWNFFGNCDYLLSLFMFKVTTIPNLQKSSIDVLHLSDYLRFFACLIFPRTPGKKLVGLVHSLDCTVCAVSFPWRIVRSNKIVINHEKGKV